MWRHWQSDDPDRWGLTGYTQSLPKSSALAELIRWKQSVKNPALTSDSLRVAPMQLEQTGQ